MGRSAAVGRFERATYMMTFRGSLGLVAIFGLFSMAAASPWFYHGLEGPSFTEKNTTSSGDLLPWMVQREGRDRERKGALPRAEGGQGPVRRRDVLHGGVRLPFQAHRQAQRGLGQARVHRLSPLSVCFLIFFPDATFFFGSS